MLPIAGTLAPTPPLSLVDLVGVALRTGAVFVTGELTPLPPTRPPLFPLPLMEIGEAVTASFEVAAAEEGGGLGELTPPPTSPPSFPFLVGVWEVVADTVDVVASEV